MSAPQTELGAAIAALTRALSASGSAHMVIGGIAVIARGAPRHTDDVDATIQAEGLDLERLLELLGREGIVPRIPNALGFAQRHQVLLLRHEPSRTEIEVSLAWLPFELEALARAELIDLGGARARIATAEDLVVYKAVAFRERDRGDIERLLELHGADIDIGRVTRIVQQFAAALDEPERAIAFSTLVKKVLARS